MCDVTNVLCGLSDYISIMDISGGGGVDHLLVGVKKGIITHAGVT